MSLSSDTRNVLFQAAITALLTLLLASNVRLDNRVENLSAVATRALVEASEANAKLEALQWRRGLSESEPERGVGRLVGL